MQRVLSLSKHSAWSSSDCRWGTVGRRDVEYTFFSRSGFTDGLVSSAAACDTSLQPTGRYGAIRTWIVIGCCSFCGSPRWENHISTRQKYSKLVSLCRMKRKTLLNASIGTLILVTTPSFPSVSLLAGGMAGYLESKTPRVGARIGTIAGAVALAVVLISSMLREILAAFDHGIAHYLWVGLGSPATNGILSFIVWPLLGGAIGAYIRSETASN